MENAAWSRRTTTRRSLFDEVHVWLRDDIDGQGLRGRTPGSSREWFREIRAPGPGRVPHLLRPRWATRPALLGVCSFHSNKLPAGGISASISSSSSPATSSRRSSSAEKQATPAPSRSAPLDPARGRLSRVALLMPAAAYCWLFAQPRRVRASAPTPRDPRLRPRTGAASSRSGSYFSRCPSPLEHTWSLAIEEQFYMIWPLVAVWAPGGGSERTIRSRSCLPASRP